MAAIFYNLSQNNAVFKAGFPVVSPVMISFFKDNAFQDMMAIITNVSLQNNETLQFFLSFDDLISYMYFGKGLGMATINGMLFSDCDGALPGLDNKESTSLFDTISSIRGKPVVISYGHVSFTGILVSYNINTLAEPDVMADFQLNIQLIDSTLATPDFPDVICPTGEMPGPFQKYVLPAATFTNPSTGIA